MRYLLEIDVTPFGEGIQTHSLDEIQDQVWWALADDGGLFYDDEVEVTVTIAQIQPTG